MAEEYAHQRQGAAAFGWLGAGVPFAIAAAPASKGREQPKGIGRYFKRQDEATSPFEAGRKQRGSA